MFKELVQIDGEPGYLHAVSGRVRFAMPARVQGKYVVVSSQFGYRIADTFQYNDGFLQFLDENRTDAGIMYEYVRTVTPLFRWMLNDSGTLRDIRVYSSNKRLSEVLPEFDKSAADPLAAEATRYRSSWIVLKEDRHMMLAYYCALYDKLIVRRIGVVRMSCAEDFFTSLWEEGSTLRLIASGEEIYASGNISAAMVDGTDAALSSMTQSSDATSTVALPGGISLNIIRVSRINGYLCAYSSLPTLVFPIKAEVLSLLLVSVCMVNVLFFLLIFHPLNNISRLSSHMKTGALRVFPCSAGRDETGELIRSFNQLVVKTNEAVETSRKNDMLLMDARISALKAQMNPHFFYGTLECIRMMAEAANQEDIAEMTYAFSGLMRYSLSDKRLATLREEFDIARQYLDIQIKRSDPPFVVTWDLDERCYSVICPHFIVEPLVENVVVHGVRKTRKQAHLCLTLRREGEDAVIVVADDGPGMSSERLEELRAAFLSPVKPDAIPSEGNGRGLLNLYHRLSLCYQDQFRMTLASQPYVHTEIRLQIPMQGISLAVCNGKENADVEGAFGRR